MLLSPSAWRCLSSTVAPMMPAGLALAHRRLSILDLSPAGHQPMQSPCGRFVLVYNGEIYNYEDLRVDLEREGGNFCLARPFGYRDPACRAAPLGDSGDAGAG